MRYLLLRMKRFCGFITGFVFFISGILKLLDPVGAGLVMDSYFDFLHIGFMGFAAKPLGTAFALAETIIGTGLITGVWRRTVAPIAIAFQGLFTFLTLLLVTFKPEMDCGCFGEAIHLTHTQTFVKNIILCVLLLTYYIPAKHLGQTTRKKYVSFGVITVSVIAFTVYSWMYIPLMDFTDFKPAAVLQAGNAFAIPVDEMYEEIYIYEKDGEQAEFDLDHTPDTTWTYVDKITRIKPELQDNSVSLSFYDKEGQYLDNFAVDGKVMIVSVYDPQMSHNRWKETAGFLERAADTGFYSLLLVSSTPEQFEKIMNELEPHTKDILERDLYFSDYKTLIAMNRSNAGVTYFSDGYLIRKWARRALPDNQELEEIFEGDDTESLIEEDTHSSLTFQGFLLYVFAVMLLL